MGFGGPGYNSCLVVGGFAPVVILARVIFRTQAFRLCFIRLTVRAVELSVDSPRRHVTDEDVHGAGRLPCRGVADCVVGCVSVRGVRFIMSKNEVLAWS